VVFKTALPRRTFFVARPSQASHRLQAYTLLLINTLCWGAAIVIVKPSLELTTPFRFLLYRFTLASLLSLPLMIHYWPQLKHKARVLPRIIGIEFLGNTVALGLLYLGLDRMGAIETNLIVSTSPLFTILAGIILLKEREEKQEWLGLGLALVGTLLLITLPIFTQDRALSQFSVLGIFFLISQNAVAALSSILAKKNYVNVPKMFAASINFYVGMISFGLLSWVEVGFSTQTAWTTITTELSSRVVLLPVAYMALFGSMIGLVCYLKGLDLIEASEATLFSYLHPLVYIPLGILLLNEPFSLLQATALALVLIGVAVSELRWPVGRRR
jgi:drug/metabolite transporter (DMT)-like permease